MSVNKCTFIGRCGKDPEVRQVNNDFKVANFSIACSEKWTDKQTGESKEQTEWINVQANNNLATIIEKYVKKGDLIYIEGKFKTRDWEKDGQKHYASYIQIEKIEMLGNKPTNQTSEELPVYESPVKSSGLPPSEMAHSNPKTEPEPDDLPF